MKKLYFVMVFFALAMIESCGQAKLYHDFPPLEFENFNYGFKTEQTTLNGIQVAYYDSKTAGTPIVLIHGLASNMGFWRYVIPQLEQKGFRVIAIDLPGYGKSAKPYSAPYTLSFYAKTINELLKSLSIEQAIWAGHSMGGQISIVAALNFPERIEKLVLIAPAGIEAFKQGEGEWLRNATTPDFIKNTPPDRIRANYSNNFYTWKDQYEWMIEERLRMMKAKDFDRFAYVVWKCVGAMLDEPVWDKLDRISFSTLIVAGENDNLIPNPFLHGGTTSDIMNFGKEKIKHAKLVMLPQTGHMLIVERPKELAQEIEKFVK
ncbi:MAG: alpha/beta fold hydrolase [Chlorobiales bacterium]